MVYIIVVVIVRLEHTLDAYSLAASRRKLKYRSTNALVS